MKYLILIPFIVGYGYLFFKRNEDRNIFFDNRGWEYKITNFNFESDCFGSVFRRPNHLKWKPVRDIFLSNY